MIREFLEATYGSMEGNVVLGTATGRVDSGKLRVDSYTWFRYPLELDKMVEFAQKKRSGDQRNVYYSPIVYGDKRNAKDQISRSIDNALMVQTIYLDSDDCPPDAFRIPPSIHVQTSEAHGHDYWQLASPIPASEAAEIAHRITTAHEDDGSDPTGWSANKVLRIPDTVNTTYDQKNPWKITAYFTGALYDALDISGAYDDVEIPEAERQKAVLSVPTDIPELADLPDFMTLVNSIPADEKRLNDLIYKVPKRGSDGWQSQQRWALLADLLRFGFSVEETVAIAWHCPAAQKWREDQRGIHGLWGEAEKAWRTIEFERNGNLATVSSVDEIADGTALKRGPGIVKILTTAERMQFETRQDFTTEYMEWARGKVKVFNEPYHAINVWTYLSAILGDVASIPKPAGEMPLNIWSMTLGTSSSGKSEGLGIMWTCINAFFPIENPDIGGDNSKPVLIERMLERQNRTIIFHDDEADGVMGTWKQGGWTQGIPQTLTKTYDGKISQIGRVGKADLQVSNAWGILISHLVGTPEGMFGVLDRGMFKTGYLARQIWVIGHDIEPTRDQLKLQLVKGDVSVEYEAMPKYWADVFRRRIHKVRQESGSGLNRIQMQATDEAAKRYDDAVWFIRGYFKKLRDPDIFDTAVRRMSDIILKAAALLALSESRAYIALKDMITVLGFAERWLGDLIYVTEGISSSAFSKACDDIEAFIAGRKGLKAEASEIYSVRRGEDVYQVDRYLESLKKQKRIVHESPKGIGGPTYYALAKRKIEPEEESND